MENNFENQNLLTLKKNHLKNLSTLDDFSSFKKVSSYLFHGVNLSFYTKNLSFAKKVLMHLPSDWQLNKFVREEAILKVYLDDGWNENWDYESNPDCLIDKNNNYESAIQRDFIGVDYKTYAILSLTSLHADGIFNSLRWLLPRRMLLTDTFLLHSSCVIENGKAFFFLGHSGAGKSTVASLSGERIVLGDDMNVMRFDGTKAFAKAGGLGGLSFSNTDFDKEFEVEGFYWLEQHKDNKCSLMKPSLGATKILASLANVFWETMDSAQRDKLLNLALSISNNIDFYHLKFSKDERFWSNVVNK